MIDMSILSWILLGLIAGVLGSKIVNRPGEGIFLDIVLGIIGAVAGGYLFSFLGAARLMGLNFSVLVALAGAILVLVVYHGIRRITGPARLAGAWKSDARRAGNRLSQQRRITL
jgi:uncharacterized membrane protein YeaQ/YmgE (transglycosylase-associated protein family)